MRESSVSRGWGLRSPLAGDVRANEAAGAAPALPRGVSPAQGLAACSWAGGGVTRWPRAALPSQPRGDCPPAEKKRSEWPGACRERGLQPSLHLSLTVMSPAAPSRGSLLCPGEAGAQRAGCVAHGPGSSWAMALTVTSLSVGPACRCLPASSALWPCLSAPRACTWGSGTGQVAPAPQRGPGNHGKRKRVCPARPRALCLQGSPWPGTGLFSQVPQWLLTAGPLGPALEPCHWPLASATPVSCPSPPSS